MVFGRFACMADELHFVSFPARLRHVFCHLSTPPTALLYFSFKGFKGRFLCYLMTPSAVGHVFPSGFLWLARILPLAFADRTCWPQVGHAWVKPHGTTSFWLRNWLPQCLATCTFPDSTLQHVWNAPARFLCYLMTQSAVGHVFPSGFLCLARILPLAFADRTCWPQVGHAWVKPHGTTSFWLRNWLPQCLATCTFPDSTLQHVWNAPARFLCYLMTQSAVGHVFPFGFLCLARILPLAFADRTCWPQVGHA